MELKYKITTNGYTLCSVPSLKYARKVCKALLTYMLPENVKLISYISGKELKTFK